VRAFSSGKMLEIRNPRATRPWQHVLEPLRGYVTLAEKLYDDGAKYASAWNFGPQYTDAQPVEWIVRYLSANWGSQTRWKIDAHEHVHEAQMLKLDWSKAHAQLGWQPVLSLPEALNYTLAWYQQEAAGARARELCLTQIADYSAKAARNS
jgi:CDP-glucose 4,6-dehydratase